MGEGGKDADDARGASVTMTESEDPRHLENELGNRHFAAGGWVEIDN